MSKGFTHQNVGDQSNKTFFITGANTGLGFESAMVLAGKNARVLLGCRSRDKANAAREKILAHHKSADLKIIDIDLGDLASIKRAAEEVSQEKRLDVLINNAGLMIPPFQKTRDGFESQFGVNHLGAFALTAQLLDKLEENEGARIVNTASNAHKMGKVDFDDLNAEKGYSAMKQYALSKLANLLHMYELERRLRKASRKTIALAVHPGGSDTDLSRHLGAFSMKVILPLARPFVNTALMGAWPTLMGATHEGVSGGEYYGPRGAFEVKGPAVKVKSNKRSHDEELQKKLWERSLEMTGVNSPI